MTYNIFGGTLNHALSSTYYTVHHTIHTQTRQVVANCDFAATACWLQSQNRRAQAAFMPKNCSLPLTTQESGLHSSSLSTYVLLTDIQ